MKLYEKMLAGAKLTKQAFGDFFVRAGKKNDGTFTGSTCVIGACIHFEFQNQPGFLHKTNYYVGEFIKLHSQFLFTFRTKHPVSGHCAIIYNIIVDLNDQHNWSREKIAEWLKDVEEYYEEHNTNR